ncbi:MAG: hypothetical protein ACP59X_16975 [Solidesulfovibrio sp. DCME]|uniref:hypothetical protein n=1 Tax=Solidesulfovibrio sp. DCME TaxID=3447380 RepID=UPI003D0FDAB4
MRIYLFFFLLLVPATCLAQTDLIETAACPDISQLPADDKPNKPGDTFHHEYWIENKGDCDMVITKVKKSWYSVNAKQGKPSALVKTSPKEGTYSTDPIGEIIYDTNYRVKPNTKDVGWDINFYSTKNVKSDEIYSCFIYYGYFDSKTCTQQHFDKQFKNRQTTGAVKSSIRE